MRRLVEARQRGVEAEFWPQRVDHAIAMQPCPWCQREKLHQSLGVTAPPLAGR
jgi:hypothetical protein